MGAGALPQWLGLRDEPIETGRGFGIFGILNLTPDSFFDGGLYEKPDVALKRANLLLQSGADILDLGAESSRPGSLPLRPGMEKERLLPVLKSISRNLPPCKISVDTWHAETAASALQNGAGIINDVSACLWDSGFMDVLVEYKPAYILMHNSGTPDVMQKSPHYHNIVSEMLKFFEIALDRLLKAGLPENRIVLDPGIGFGKTASHNMAILQNLSVFSVFGRPLLLGISMKSFFGDFFSLPLAERGAITAVASVLAWQKGVFWHRVHDPLTVSNSLQLAEKMGSAHSPLTE